ncbi:hypothetical protein K645_681 [Blattabacterium sp. (Nauphoeta cinerea)]|uniref:DUF4290 domain-containing protein n=1 Tax=Blattabacterium sp. (Nauphoeta cinerea) TaxID=1316444 RepID=UPI0003B10543|nr:DUF4290 domain-containing protein [Blattabacterium sp. (Nauphoeta cinerea)]AGW85915.1 hypothetical protein K645_681 [Blattabacterium sp. (Nauphoeta cinerea)]
MEYNTNRFKLVIPEYGRNIHKMIDYAIQIKNRKKRNRYAWGIIKLMTSSTYPKFHKSIHVFQHKLWNQLLIMSKYQLDIDSPFPKPSPKEIYNMNFYNKKVVYPEYLTNFRYYGKIIRNMIHVAIHCKNTQKKEGLFYAIANTMKKNYLRWNKNMVEDDIIFKDLKELSKGKICLMNNTDALLQCSHILKYKKKKNLINK